MIVVDTNVLLAVVVAFIVLCILVSILLKEIFIRR